MRINLTKKDLINSVYMRLGYSKKISEILLDDIRQYYFVLLLKRDKAKLSNFGTFTFRAKKSRIGRNPKTKEKKIISNRNVVLFKPSNELKNYINNINEKI